MPRKARWDWEERGIQPGQVLGMQTEVVTCHPHDKHESTWILWGFVLESATSASDTGISGHFESPAMGRGTGITLRAAGWRDSSCRVGYAGN